MSDVAHRVHSYYDNGIFTTPVVVFNNAFPIYGAPDETALRDCVEQLLDIGEIDAPVPTINNSQTT